MACFAVPAAEAIVSAIATQITKKKEQNTQAVNKDTHEEAVKIPFSRKLKWLTRLLMGGSILLGFEHFWHGEIVPYFPFLSAASNPADAEVMLTEMATTGVTMALLVTVVWVGMLIVSSAFEKRALKETKIEETN